MAEPSKHVARRRETSRKRIMRQVLNSSDYVGRPVLLDELRWVVFESQFGCAGDAIITRSWLNSFARTVREQLSEYQIEKVPIQPETPIGLVAKTAVYRQKDTASLRAFLLAKDACILCRWKTNLEVNQPRYTRRYVTPHHHVATFRFFESRPAHINYDTLQATPGTLIPTTQELTLLVPRGTQIDLRSITTVSWKLFGCGDLSEWYEVDANDPLSNVRRDKQF